eukprot:CAMPEP_0197718602 /NCGR_PEP_ID=MMETSP1434-20131217/2693_1 /TAXON_ID=265543 /ORGANISM="Minutocellus polymorphus, Strain CCMP3303" /LENGTH=413 /DNA_ID=CAMNT_0043303277 /DNA_START=28 /DNA_END=1266 /DNA_ORIENTATION=-
MALRIPIIIALLSQATFGFVPRLHAWPSSSAISPHHLVGNVNVAEHELPLNRTNSAAASTTELSDDQLEIVAKYKQLLKKKFPATMVRHTMMKEGNDEAELLRAVFDDLGDDDTIAEMTKPIQQVKKESREKNATPTHHKQAKFEDPTGFFPSNGGSGGYVPAGLSENEYANLKKEEADQKEGKNYGAWGPRFDPSDKPVADDMAWMAMPDLWTGKVSDENLDGESSVGDGSSDEDPELPLDDPAFLSDSRPWIHADAKRSDVYLKGWRTTYSRFCRGETVQQLMLDLVSPERAVRHILEGVVVYGGKDMIDSQTCIDLNRIGIYSPPSKSDWDAMAQAENEIFGEIEGGIAARADIIDERTGELMLCGVVTRPDFLRTIVQIGQTSETTSEADVLDRFGKEDLQEMYLCMDW